MQAFFTALLTYLTPTVAAAIICAVIAVATYAYQRALQALPSNVRVQVQALANTVVQAIEQKYHLTETGGALKKQEAMRQMMQIAAGMGLKIDEAHASAAIEAAVYGINLWRDFESRNTQPLKIIKDAQDER